MKFPQEECLKLKEIGIWENFDFIKNRIDEFTKFIFHIETFIFVWGEVLSITNLQIFWIFLSVMPSYSITKLLPKKLSQKGEDKKVAMGLWKWKIGSKECPLLSAFYFNFKRINGKEVDKAVFISFHQRNAPKFSDMQNSKGAVGCNRDWFRLESGRFTALSSIGSIARWRKQKGII